MERPNEKDAEERIWPLHQRIAGGLVRSALAAIGFFLPLVLLFRARELPFVAALTFLFAGGALVAERRDSTVLPAAARLFAGGFIAMVLSPVAIVWLETIGDPRAAYGELGRLFTKVDLEEGLFVALAGGGFGLFLGLPVLVRTRTTEPRHVLLTGLGLAAIPSLLVLAEGAAGPALAMATSFELAVLGIVLGDRLAARVDPACPEPLGGSLGRAWAAWVPLALAGVCLVSPLFSSFGHHHRGGDSAAIGALKTISTSQSIFREGDKDGNDVTDYAASLAELSETQLIDSVLGAGVKQGYTFRLSRSVSTPELLWAAAADPVIPGETGHRYFFTNQAGAIFYTTSGPIPLAPDCAPPPWALPIGK